MFLMFGFDFLKELWMVFVDGYVYIQCFIDMYDFGDMLVGCGFFDFVMDMEVIILIYDDFDVMFVELWVVGFGCVMMVWCYGLIGWGLLMVVWVVYEKMCCDGKLLVIFEVIYGYVWKVEVKQMVDGWVIVCFDLLWKK